MGLSMAGFFGVPVLLAGGVTLVWALLCRAPFLRRAGLAVLAVWLCLIGVSLLPGSDVSVVTTPPLVAVFGAIAVAAAAVTGGIGESVGPWDD
jgi:hypothetical protein